MSNFASAAKHTHVHIDKNSPKFSKYQNKSMFQTSSHYKNTHIPILFIPKKAKLSCVLLKLALTKLHVFSDIERNTSIFYLKQL